MCWGSRGADDRSREIDHRLKEDAKRVVYKLLLLGAGESGKSVLFCCIATNVLGTFSKQMKVLHAGGFTDDERNYYRTLVHKHILYGVEQIKAAPPESLQVKFSDESKQYINTIDPEFAITPATVPQIKTIYSDPAFKEFSTKKSFHTLDNIQYYLENLDRIAAADYVPNDEDCLRCRAATTGIQEMKCIVEGVDFLIVDVGGQRSERRKWAHCFEEVSAIIFFVSLSEYNLTLFEDGVTNRMVESLSLFSSLCSMQWFRNTTMILFLNKKDLFEEKIKKENITIAFPDYTGAQEFDPAVEFIKGKFQAINDNPGRKIFPHVTCATDTENVKHVFNSVKTSVLATTIKNAGLF